MTSAPGRPTPLLDAVLFGRHQVASIVASGLDFGVMIALVEIARLRPPIATAISAMLGGVANFVLLRVWTFRARHGGTALGQAVRYLLIAAGGALLNALLLAGVLSVSVAHYAIARIAVAVAVGVFYTYPLHTRFVFQVRR